MMIVESIEWTRLSEFSDFYDFDYIPYNGICPSDVKMGNIQDDWFLAGVAALAEYPERMMRILVDDSLTEKGIYAYNMYALGVPFT